MKLLVLGGTRFLSQEVAAQAVTRGWDVTCACRGQSGPVPDGATHLPWDRAEAVPDAVTDGGWDAVVDVTRLPSQARSAVAATAYAHWVFVSTISVYADNSSPAMEPLVEPVTDDVDLAVDPEAYGGMKVACEQAVRSVASSSVVARPGLIVGPGDPTGRFAYWPQRLARGGEVLAPGRPDDVVQVIDVRDLAAWLLDLAESRTTGVLDAVGQPLPFGELLAQVAAGVGNHDPALTWVESAYLEEQGVEPWAGEGSLPLWLPRPEYDGMLAHDPGPAVAAGLRLRSVAETAPGLPRLPRARALAPSARPRCWRPGTPADRAVPRADERRAGTSSRSSARKCPVDSVPARGRARSEEQGGPRVLSIPATSARKREPFSPSMWRWSKDSASVVTSRTTISPVSSSTHGRLLIAPKHRIADSPGLMIGVPASTPKTPTLVIVNVPPAISAGCVLPSRAVAVSSTERRRQLGHREAVGVLDVGHDQAARRGGRDAEVDVVLVDDLLRGLVPERVDLRRALHREDDRAGEDEQRADPDVAEVGALLEPRHELHRRGHVDGDPLGDVRAGEGRLAHRRRHHLAHALDRLAGLALARCATSCEVATHRVLVRMTQPARGRAATTAPWTSSRVIEPDGPEPVSVVRSTPRSLASLRTGGFARARTSPGSACAAGGTSASAGAAAGAGRWSVAGTGDSSAGSTSSRLGAAGRERALHLQLGLGAGLGARRGRAAAGPAHRAALGLDPADEGRALHRAGRGRVGQVDVGRVDRRPAPAFSAMPR